MYFLTCCINVLWNGYVFNFHSFIANVESAQKCWIACQEWNFLYISLTYYAQNIGHCSVKGSMQRKYFNELFIFSLLGSEKFYNWRNVRHFHVPNTDMSIEQIQRYFLSNLFLNSDLSIYLAVCVDSPLLALLPNRSRLGRSRLWPGLQSIATRTAYNFFRQCISPPLWPDVCVYVRLFQLHNTPIQLFQVP